jgi:hypothetical protein
MCGVLDTDQFRAGRICLAMVCRQAVQQVYVQMDSDRGIGGMFHHTSHHRHAGLLQLAGDDIGVSGHLHRRSDMVMVLFKIQIDLARLPKPRHR